MVHASLPLSVIRLSRARVALLLSQLVIPKNATKSLIPLSIGDPTVFGNLNIPLSIEDALIKVIQVGGDTCTWMCT